MNKDYTLALLHDRTGLSKRVINKAAKTLVKIGFLGEEYGNYTFDKDSQTALAFRLLGKTLDDKILKEEK